MGPPSVCHHANPVFCLSSERRQTHQHMRWVSLLNLAAISVHIKRHSECL